MNKKSVCWNITSKCNENCKFCYRILCDKENTLEENKKILNILVSLKVDKITWTGGECLLYPHLIKLMKEAHKNNIKNNIITNGKALTKELIDEIEEYTTYITFSLDSLSDTVNENIGRGREHGRHILELMDYIVNEEKDIKIKLNSILTSQNVYSIIEVAKIVEKYPIKRWKIFKFLPLRGDSLTNRNKFEIEDEVYNQVVKKMKEKDLKCPIIECKEEDIENKYLLINPKGEFLITTNRSDKVICNYKDMKIKENF